MAPPTSGPANLSWLTGFQVGELSLRPLKVSYRDGASGETAELLLHQAALDIPAAPQPIRLRARARTPGAGFAIEGSVGAPGDAARTQASLPRHPERHRRPNPGWSCGAKRNNLCNSAASALRYSPRAGSWRTWRCCSPRPGLLAERARAAGARPAFGWRIAWDGASREAGMPSASRPWTSPSATRADGILARRQPRIAPVGRSRLRVSDMNLELEARDRRSGTSSPWPANPSRPPGATRCRPRVSGPRRRRRCRTSPSRWDRGRVSISPCAGRSGRREPRRHGPQGHRRGSAPVAPGEAASSPQLPPFRLQARVRDRRGGYALDQLMLEVAGSKVAATVDATRSDGRLRISGKARRR